MKSLEFNKVAAALLVAGITVLGTGIFANQVFKDHHHDDDHAKRAFPVLAEGEQPKSVEAASKEVVIEDINALLATASVEKGQKITKKCMACHSFDDGGKHKVGPNMWNIVGAKKAAKDGYSYSKALIEMGGQWSYDSLNKFFYKPKDYVAGTKMNYAGLKKTQDRADLIAYLRTLSASPIALPVVAAPEPQAEPAPAVE